MCHRKHLRLHLHWTRHLLMQLCRGLLWQWHHLHSYPSFWNCFLPFPFPTPFFFFQQSIIASFKAQTARCLRHAATPVLERTLVRQSSTIAPMGVITVLPMPFASTQDQALSTVNVMWPRGTTEMRPTVPVIISCSWRILSLLVVNLFFWFLSY